MKVKKALSLIFVTLLVGSGISFYFINKNRAKAPGATIATSTQNIPVASTPTSIGKSLRTCDEFNAAATLAVGVGKQSVDFPQPFGNTVICGTNEAEGRTYYISPATSEQIQSYYKIELRKQGYIVNEGPDDTGGRNPLFTFRNEKAYGVIYTYPSSNAYYIDYSLKQ